MGSGPSKGKADRITHLTEHEKSTVQSIWRAFTKAHRDDYGVILLTRMFAEHPSYLQLFEKYKHLQVDELRNDEKFRSLGFTVGTNLTNQIELLGDPENMLRVVKKNAAFHARVPGITPEHFANFAKVIVEVLKEKQGHLMNIPAVSAWEKLFQSMNEHTSAIFAAKDLASMSVANSSRFPSPASDAAASGAPQQAVASTKSPEEKQPAQAAAAAAEDHASHHDHAQKDPGAAASSRKAATSPSKASKTASPVAKAKAHKSRSAAASKSGVRKEGGPGATTAAAAPPDGAAKSPHRQPKSAVAASKSQVKKEPKSKGSSPPS